MEKKSVFQVLNAIDVNDKVEVIDNGKRKLTYLSWAWAWTRVKDNYPDANFMIYERETEYGPVNYFTDGRTCWVKTGVTINGQEHIEELPVMDNRFNSIPLENLKSTDVNKAIQRSLTKAAARHGLGLYIYAGEDLPESAADEMLRKALEQVQKAVSRAELTAVWNQYPQLKKVAAFKDAVTQRGGEIAA